MRKDHSMTTAGVGSASSSFASSPGQRPPSTDSFERWRPPSHLHYSWSIYFSGRRRAPALGVPSSAYPYFLFSPLPSLHSSFPRSIE
ncbi:hypothetical protein NL676_009148 [Syzygium grande]|nr:hypothetical protein NL676_009148 [Syzygium grande]